MKLTLVVGTLALVALCSAVEKHNSEESINGEDEPFFVKTYRTLLRGPPEMPVKARANIVTEWITQRVDHFSSTDFRVWRMRYLSNDEYFKPGGPLFIYLGGEWEISPGYITQGHFVDMAKEHNGYLFYTEHRYYGQSWPTDDLTLDSLQYLHIKQALADLEYFIRIKKATTSELTNSKVIIAGGSYSATMVVWFKRLYPHMIDGGWASSAPLLAKVDFREYKEVVGRAFLELGSQQCYNRIQNGIAELESMMANKRAAEVKAMFLLCNNFDENNDLDIWLFFSSISNVFSGIAQYQNEGDIPNHCDYLMSFDDDLTAIANFAKWAYVCTDATYKGTLAFHSSTTYSTSSIIRQWFYQTCNEYGWFQASGSANQPFGTKFPALFYTTLCEDLYGANYTNEGINQKVIQTNLDFGGLNPEVSNIYQTHGALDPWSAMGLTELQGATVIPRASHCTDFGSISSRDSSELRASKERLAALVREWLA